MHRARKGASNKLSVIIGYEEQDHHSLCAWGFSVVELHQPCSGDTNDLKSTLDNKVLYYQCHNSLVMTQILAMHVV